MRILFIGDIFGKPGREIARRAVPALIERESLDFVIANVENSAAGFGVTGDIAETILGYGVDAMTTGNHVWDKKEVLDYIPRQPRLLRPANFPALVPGRGSYIGTIAGVILITLLQSILSVMQMAEFGRQIIYGLVIVAMLLIYGRAPKARA